MNDRTEKMLAQMTPESFLIGRCGQLAHRAHPATRHPGYQSHRWPQWCPGRPTDRRTDLRLFPGCHRVGSDLEHRPHETGGPGVGRRGQVERAHILLAPTVNMHRSPPVGRSFECYSEDPYLAGRMAVAYISGLRSQGMGGCIKHFVCNDYELLDRTGILQVKYTLPYSDLTSPTAEERARYVETGEPLEFSHTLEDQIGGQLDAGFLVTGLCEDTYGEAENEPLANYIPPLIAMRAVKP